MQYGINVKPLHDPGGISMKFDCPHPVTPCYIVIIVKELYGKSNLKCIWIFVPKRSMYAFQMHVPQFGICHSFFTDTNLDAKLFTLCNQKLYCSLVYLTLIGPMLS